MAGALTQPHWVPPAEIRARLTRTSGLADLRAPAVELPQQEEVLPRELAHDCWLRAQLAETVPGIAPGAMAAVRQLAALPSDPAGVRLELRGWLLEPVHFHLAKDHVVLVAGAAQGLAQAQAQALAQSIAPVLAQDGLSLTVASPGHWLMGDAQQALQLQCAASEAAAGRNVDGYLPDGADARRYRRLLNEIQMTWHDHPVNEQRAADGDLPLNSVWLSGPATADAVAAFREGVAGGRFRLEDSLLGPRLRDDRFAWLDALQALDARLHQWLTAPQPPVVLLCGEREARRLERRATAWRGWPGAVGSGFARLTRSLRPAQRTADGDRVRDAGPPIADSLARLFTETP